MIGLFKSEELVSRFKLPEFLGQVRRVDNSRLQTDRLLENPGMKMLSKRVKISVSMVNSGFDSLDPGCNALLFGPKNNQIKITEDVINTTILIIYNYQLVTEIYLNSMFLPDSSTSLDPADNIHQRNEEEDTSDQTRTSGSSCLGVLSECYTGHEPRDNT